MRELRNSGIEWIGDIPINWDIKRIQFCLEEIKEKNAPVQTEQVLSLVKDRGVMLYEEKGDVGNKSKTDVSEYKLAYPNTLVVNSMNILIGSVGISEYFGCVSPVYYVFKETKFADLRFINYIFNTRELQKELRRYANGILEIRLRVSASDIFKRKIPLPPKEEQTVIADYLDEKCREIDEISDSIKEQITTLEQYKVSIITEKINKGIVSSETKDSGIDWLGEISKDYVICRVKDITSLVTDGSHIAPDTSTETYKFVSVADMDDFGRIDLDNCLMITEEQYDYLVRTGCRPKARDVLISKDGTIGKTSIVDNNSDYVVASSLVIMRPNKTIIPEYLRYCLMSGFVQEQLNSLLSGSALRRVSVGKNANLKIVFCKDKRVQEAVVQYLDEKCGLIDQAIIEKKEQLDILEQYKKSLIFEYVTGKKEAPAV